MMGYGLQHTLDSNSSIKYDLITWKEKETGSKERNFHIRPDKELSVTFIAFCSLLFMVKQKSLKPSTGKRFSWNNLRNLVAECRDQNQQNFG